ncbi:hypothetical protein [Aliamphritea spongicola]|nr:hypothetical protein [Aliamphritea spongicola]
MDQEATEARWQKYYAQVSTQSHRKLTAMAVKALSPALQKPHWTAVAASAVTSRICWNRDLMCRVLIFAKNRWMCAGSVSATAPG